MDDLLGNISENKKNELLKIFKADTFIFKKDSTILNILKQNNIIVYIEYGHIEIIRNDYDGNTTIIENLKDHSTFSNITSFISSNDYEIITKEDSKIIVFDYDNIINYNAYFKPYNIFIKNLLNILANKTLEKTERLEVITKKTIRDKLLEYFEIISKKNGSKKIVLSSSFTKLAEYLGVDRSSMSRELNSLKKEGFIDIKGRKITLKYKM